jgi:hypothetical protein
VGATLREPLIRIQLRAQSRLGGLLTSSSVVPSAQLLADGLFDDAPGAQSGLYQTQSMTIRAGKSVGSGAGSQGGATAKFAM